jgi:predicted metal-dependent hydrolase
MQSIEYKIVRKFNLKHTYIYIKSDSTIEVRTNLTTRKKYIEEFVFRKSNWIQKKLELIKSTKVLDDTKFYLFGELCDRKDFEFSLLEEFYKQKAKEVIDPLVEKWSYIMNLYPTHVGYRNNKTRWGSCSGKNRLSFNTNLAKMHPDFIEYVVVHELAHIKHKNHSHEFWDHVKEFLPDYKKRQSIKLT